jgi:hypothetical protein
MRPTRNGRPQGRGFLCVPGGRRQHRIRAAKCGKGNRGGRSASNPVPGGTYPGVSGNPAAACPVSKGMGRAHRPPDSYPGLMWRRGRFSLSTWRNFTQADFWLASARVRLAHVFRVDRDSGIILWKAKMYFRVEPPQPGSLRHSGFHDTKRDAWGAASSESMDAPAISEME